MSTQQVPDDKAIVDGLEALIKRQEPAVKHISVKNLKALTGGNARRAWAFDTFWQTGTERRKLECILLARVDVGQLEIDGIQEFTFLRALHPTGLPVPEPLWIDPDGMLLGMPGVVMARSEGVTGLVELLKPTSANTRNLASQLVQLSAKMHGLDPAALTPAILGPHSSPAAATHALLRKWRIKFEQVRMEPLPALSEVFAWLEEHVPHARRLAVVHGDLRIGNFLHNGHEITALLDWEMAHLGDPLEDIAWMYRKMWGPQRFLGLEDAVSIYEEFTGAKVEKSHLAWWRIFSEAKFATISLTAARNFIDGKTDNLRHAGRAPMATECMRLSLEWIRILETEHVD